MIFEGKLITNKESFYKRLVMNGSEFVLMTGSLEMKKWKRFEYIDSCDYFYMQKDYPDAI